MSRNSYSNLSREELLKLLAEKDAQLEKSSTEIRTLREEKQVQKELMAQETQRELRPERPRLGRGEARLRRRPHHAVARVGGRALDVLTRDTTVKGLAKG